MSFCRKNCGLPTIYEEVNVYNLMIVIFCILEGPELSLRDFSRGSGP
jgi:hypothetical protein